eukprot:maker-scaffold13_size735724-snap-gene-6.27 protein:Tk03470 transcript:maker-scaffold13_size735724-snap-gene-6.27-mRNA-1 annotation:"pkd2 "
MGDVEEGVVRSRPASSLSRGAERAQTAGNIVRAMSRPGSTKSVAWSDDVPFDPEAGEVIDEQEDIIQETGYSKELEEELNRDPMDDKEDVTIGCWAQFTSVISSLWDTTDMSVGEEREILVRTTLRELVVYIVYLIILCVVTLSAMTPTMYRYTEIVKSTFESEREINQIQDFWSFLENELMDGIYVESWYNEGDDWANNPCPGHPDVTGPCPIDHHDRMVMHANRLLGVPRLRQLRVHNHSCTVPDEFNESIDVCYDHYSESIEDESDFGPGYRKYTSADAWRYQNVKELEGKAHWGMEATYSGAGSVQNLKEKRNETVAILRELKEGFTQYGTVKLLRYITPSEYGLMGLEIVFAVFVFYYIIEELIELSTLRLQYFTTFWNFLDLFMIVVSVATLGFNVYLSLKVTNLLKSLLAEPELFADFSYLEYWSKTFQDAAALTVFTGWIKVFKYISFNKTMSQLSGTITRCASDVAAFSVMFFIVFCAYAQIGYLMFGVHMKEFSTFTDSCFTQFRLILGDFDFPAIERSHRFWGPVYFLTYVFLVFFVLMNMFLAIINDTYSEVKEEVNNRKEEFQVGDYISRGYNNVREMFFTRDKLLDIRATVKLAADDGVVTYDEIRENLRKLNFSDLEIEIFCSKYDKDGNFEFTLEEINAIEQGVEDKFENNHHLFLERETNKEDMDRPSSGLPKMTRREFDAVQVRVDRMEEQMGNVVSKVNDVLQKLDTFDSTRKGSAQAINRGVRDIASAKANDAEKRTEMEKLVQGELGKIEED